MIDDNPHDMIHGGSLDFMKAAFPTAPKPWIDVSTGINPWPYPIGRISTDDIAHLPDQRAYKACHQAMADYLQVDAQNLLLVPGTELIIRLLPYILKAETVEIISPTYGDHLLAWQNTGHRITEISDQAVADACSAKDILVLCNPNNPDGRLLQRDQLNYVRRIKADGSGWLIVDEAYADLTPEHSMVPYAGEDGLIILRSFGKFFGLAGLRLGGIIAPPELIHRARHMLGVWPISNLALQVGRKAYGDVNWQHEMRGRLHQARHDLDIILADNQITNPQGTDLFRYIQVQNAHELWQHLAAHGIYVRRFKWSDQHLRMGLPQGRHDRQRLDAALSAFQL